MPSPYYYRYWNRSVFNFIEPSPKARIYAYVLSRREIPYHAPILVHSELKRLPDPSYLLRAKAVAAQSVRSRAQPEDRGGYLPPVARAELDSETNVFDRARADLTLRLTKHDSALQRHAAEVWTRRERLVAVERLRRSLPEVWRPSTTPAGDEFARILAALAGPRRYAEALLSKCDTLAEESASLELAAREAEFLLRASEAGESRRNELDRSLAATSEALEVFLLASERRRRRCGARAALPSGKRRSRTRPETRRLISTD